MAVEDSLDIFGSDPFGRDIIYGLSSGQEGLGLQPPPQGLPVDTRPYDQMQPTPRGFISGLFSDVLGRTLNMPSMPRTGIPSLDLLYANRNPLFNLMNVGDVQKTAERISYGQPLTTGSGMTLRPREETIFAGMAVAPFAPVAGRVAGRMIKATDGMPVGMSIKSVGKNIFEDATKYHQKVPEIKTINVNNLKRMNSGEVADVSDEVAAKMDFSEPIKVSVFADGELRIVDGHHRVAAAKKLGIQSLPVELQAINAKGATLNKLAQEATYPQQAALDLAQQRAALPVEQGGLGLLVGNTPEMRYQAMKGIEGNFLHGSKNPDIEKFKTRKQIFEESANDPNRAIAENHYANERNAVFASSDPEFTTAFSQHGYTDVGQAPTSYPLKMIGGNKVFDFENPAHLDMLKQKYAEMFPVKTIGREGYVPSEESIRMHTINKRIENLPNDTNNWPAIESQDFQKAIRELGFDAFHVNERGTKNIGVYDPSSLRSPFAAFDPFRRNVATATAMGVALPDLLAQPVNQYQPTYETIPMYTDPFGNTIGSSIR